MAERDSFWIDYILLPLWDAFACVLAFVLTCLIVVVGVTVIAVAAFWFGKYLGSLM